MTRNRLFILIMIFLLISIITVAALGQQQDEVRKKNFTSNIQFIPFCISQNKSAQN